MKQIFAKIKLDGLQVKAILYVEKSNFFIRIRKVQFSPNNLISIPAKIGN